MSAPAGGPPGARMSESVVVQMPSQMLASLTTRRPVRPHMDRLKPASPVGPGPGRIRHATCCPASRLPIHRQRPLSPFRRRPGRDAEDHICPPSAVLARFPGRKSLRLLDPVEQRPGKPAGLILGQVTPTASGGGHYLQKRSRPVPPKGPDPHRRPERRIRKPHLQDRRAIPGLAGPAPEHPHTAVVTPSTRRRKVSLLAEPPTAPWPGPVPLLR